MSFEDLRAFFVVAQEGSFLAAADALGVSRTSLRRQVDALEAQAGVPLLERTEKGVALTDAGRKLVEDGRAMEREFRALLLSIRDTGRRPEGEVRILLPVGLPPAALASLYALVQTTWPKIVVHVRFADAPLAEIGADTDVVVWLGGHAPSGAWEVRSIAPARQRLLADRAYLDARGTPRSLGDLEGHALLAWTAPGEDEHRLVTTAGATIPFRPKMSSTSVDFLHDCARMGLGIAWTPDAALPAPTERAALVPVLEAEIGRDVPVRLAVPRRLADVPKVRVFLEHLEAMRAAVLGAPAAPAPPAPARRERRR